jgi:hypothetical protein
MNAAPLWAITASCNIPLQMGDNQWNIISLPCDPGAENKVADIFGDELPTDGYGVSWGIFKYIFNNGVASYALVSLDDPLTLGKGYWAIQLTGSSVNIHLPDSTIPTSSNLSSGSGPCLSTASQGCMLTPQQPGNQWQLNGNPFQYDVAWSSLRVTDGFPCRVWIFGNGCNIEEAAQTYHPKGWRYNPASGAYEILSGNTPINPWSGYWGNLIGGGLFNGFDQWSWTVITPKP